MQICHVTIYTSSHKEKRNFKFEIQVVCNDNQSGNVIINYRVYKDEVILRLLFTLTDLDT